MVSQLKALNEIYFLEDAPDCERLGFDLTLILIAFAILLPGSACCCLICVALINRHYDQRLARQREEARRNRFNLLFPGNPDLILRPAGEGEVNTVQAVLEEEDPNELDAAVPTTTIQVRLDTDAEYNNQERERNN